MQRGDVSDGQNRRKDLNQKWQGQGEGIRRVIQEISVSKETVTEVVSGSRKQQNPCDITHSWSDAVTGARSERCGTGSTQLLVIGARRKSDEQMDHLLPCLWRTDGNS